MHRESINSVTGHNSIPISVTYKSSSATSDLEKASLFNFYFHSVFTQSSCVLPPITELPAPQFTCSDVVITEEEVFQALSSLDPSKAEGCDKIGPKLLKKCALVLYQPLHHLFCLSLHQAYVPEEWRMHFITPVFKAGLVISYRPTSVLRHCVVSKVSERLIYKDFLIIVRSVWFSTLYSAAVACFSL